MASSPKFYDRVLMSSTTTGTGTLTLGSAITGYQAWSVLGNGNSAYYYIEETDSGGVPNGKWEVGIGTYTSSGTTLSRDSILASSNSGSPENFGATKRIALIGAPAAVATPDIADMGGRLTLTTGVPVTTSNVSGASARTIYYTPYIHNRVSLWNGSGWVRYTFSELSLALGTLTTSIPYDVFLYDNAGTLTLAFTAWTNDSTRATDIVQQDGVWCKTGDLSKRLLGTFRTVNTTDTEDSQTNRYVSNLYNAVPRELMLCPGYTDGNSATSYTTTSTSYTLANGGTGATAGYVFCTPRVASLLATFAGTTGAGVSNMGLGDNSSTTCAVGGFVSGGSLNFGGFSFVWTPTKAAGAYTATLLIQVASGTGTWYADDARHGGATDPRLTYLSGTVVN